MAETCQGAIAKARGLLGHSTVFLSSVIAPSPPTPRPEVTRQHHCPPPLPSWDCLWLLWFWNDFPLSQRHHHLSKRPAPGR